MKSKVITLVFGVLVLPLAGSAQESRSRLIMPLTEGGFVAFKSETAWAGATDSPALVQDLAGELKSQASIDSDGVIHRVLLDDAGKYIFGYDLVVQPVSASQTFNIAVRPLDSQFETRLLGTDAASEAARIATLLQSSEPQILDDGDSFTLDLLVNQKVGVKIVDRVRVAFDRSKLGEDGPKILPRDFTLDAVALTVKDYRLLIDGNLFASGKPGTNFGGTLIWFYVEGHGRFIFSLVPRPGYQFQKAGVIEDNRIEFTLRGTRYEWLSSSPILPNGGTWNIWVLHDPKYQPFGTQEAVKKEKSKLDKWDDSLKAAQSKAEKIRNPSTIAFQKNPEPDHNNETAKRFRVMVGAADRIENLWPRK